MGITRSPPHVYAATAEFTKTIECDPYDHIFYSNRSACYANLDQYSKACADARRCIELARIRQGLLCLGFALFKGFLHDAMSAYERGLTVDPKNNNLIEGLGEAKLAQKQKIEAAKLRPRWTTSLRRAASSVSISVRRTRACPCGETVRRTC